MKERVKNIAGVFEGEGYKIYPASLLEKEGKTYLFSKKGLNKYLGTDDTDFGTPFKKISSYNIYKKTHSNAERLRRVFPHLNPSPCGIKTSFGFGDRLGLATPGHIRACIKSNIFPVFAQQSIREMERTDRQMEGVLDDAMWGVFQEGYKKGYGADIDHVKKEEDVLKACRCGYSMFTIDPSDYVNDRVNDMTGKQLLSAYEDIPAKATYEKNYLNKEYKVGSERHKVDRVRLMKICVLYARAIGYISCCYNIVKENGPAGFDFEASVDETRTSTSPLAHILIVEELRRQGVIFTSLALRFIGEFEKGIDYRGNLKLFEKEFQAHARICRHFGRYKLSIHSGSDKFSIYPVIGKKTLGVFHIKTAGTSWLEGVHLISKYAPSLYRRMHKIALTNFENDRKSYHVTTDLSRIPDMDKMSDENLADFLKENNSRQLMHITYGSILKKLKGEIYKTLEQYEEEHYSLLKVHLARHLSLAGADTNCLVLQA